ncbi:STAS domain-containing protein [Streptomyces violascens]|uniref:STAS domain-containing protein n=1 Tax=Streptomyces violascens TaxID=67381 RepID=UPI0036974C41
MAGARAGPEVVVDLGPVTFLDPAGLHLLDRIQQRAAQHGKNLRLLSGVPSVMRVFRHAGLESPFVRVDRMPPAVGRCRTGRGSCPPLTPPSLDARQTGRKSSASSCVTSRGSPGLGRGWRMARRGVRGPGPLPMAFRRGTRSALDHGPPGQRECPVPHGSPASSH